MADAPAPPLCRDCFARDAAPAAAGRPQRCRACGSPRVVAHPELEALAIAHVDCDAFYATIEKRDDPSLVDKPVIVGGGRRGVVATACYLARVYGVRSAMPMFRARALCPDAVVIKPDMAKYAAVGREVRAVMRELTPLVEPISIDEAFLDLAGTERIHRASPAETLARFARRVEDALGITISVGLSFNKLLAKIASDLDKPRGYSVIGRAEARAFLAGRPVTILPGVGAKAAQHLAAAGLHTVGAIAARDPVDLMRLVGAQGPRLHRLANAVDERKVDPVGERKSVSAETTFDTDIADAHALAAILRRLSEKVSRRLKADGIAGRTVTLKLKTPDFRLVTRARSLADPTRLADRIHRVAVDLLSREPPGRAYRLIGVGISELSDAADADPADLVDTGGAKRARAELAMDKIRDRFGRAAVETGLTFDAGSAERPPRKR
jgi:DNA polymerase-4